MQVLKTNFTLVKYNTQILFNINTIVGIVLILSTPLVFSLTLLSYKEISFIAELYLPISGIIFLTYIGNIETDHNVYEISYTKPTPHIFIFILRLALLLTIICVFIGGIFYYAKLQESTFPYLEIFLGSIITTLYLGLIGLTIAKITNSVPAGYLISICYLIFEFITRGKYTGDFYALSLLNTSFEEKYNILLLTIIILISNIVIIYKKS